MKGRPAWPRCRKCERRLPTERHEHADGRTFATVNRGAFETELTGRTRPHNGRSLRKQYATLERKCRRCGHVWWATK